MSSFLDSTGLDRLVNNWLKPYFAKKVDAFDVTYSNAAKYIKIGSMPAGSASANFVTFLCCNCNGLDQSVNDCYLVECNNRSDARSVKYTLISPTVGAAGKRSEIGYIVNSSGGIDIVINQPSYSAGKIVMLNSSLFERCEPVTVSSTGFVAGSYYQSVMSTGTYTGLTAGWAGQSVNETRVQVNRVPVSTGGTVSGYFQRIARCSMNAWSRYNAVFLGASGDGSLGCVMELTIHRDSAGTGGPGFVSVDMMPSRYMHSNTAGNLSFYYQVTNENIVSVYVKSNSAQRLRCIYQHGGDFVDLTWGSYAPDATVNLIPIATNCTTFHQFAKATGSSVQPVYVTAEGMVAPCNFISYAFSSDTTITPPSSGGMVALLANIAGSARTVTNGLYTSETVSVPSGTAKSIVFNNGHIMFMY